MFTFSAPGQSPPPALRRNTHGIVSDIRREVVSEIQTMVSDVRHMLKGQEGADGKHQSVSVLALCPPLNAYLPFPRLKTG